MKVTGIIAEYNPFHRGHQFHIEETRKTTGADYIIVVMSGNYTQRGEVAITDKYSRARYALENGADLVLELPVCFAAASAGYFACGGVSLLDKLGVVNNLSFGSETENTDSFMQIASLLYGESEAYSSRLRTFLKQGFSFPKARALSLAELIGDLREDALSQPNNILGIEYCCALLSLKSSIKPVTIPRIHNDYHDRCLSDDGYSSATAIRHFIESEITKDSLSALQTQLPKSVYESVRKEYGHSLPLKLNDFSALLHYRLLTESRQSLRAYTDINGDLADRIHNHIYSFTNYESFCDLLKTKQLTRSRISRGLLHILLDIKDEDMQEYKASSYSAYGRILGFRKESSGLLHAIKSNTSIPLISKLADGVKALDSLSLRMLETDIRAAHIYESTAAGKFGFPFRNEFKRQFPVIQETGPS